MPLWGRVSLVDLYLYYNFKLNFYFSGTPLLVQWLRLCASNAGDVGLIPGWGTKISHAMWHGQKKKKEKKDIYLKKKLFYIS